MWKVDNLLFLENPFSDLYNFNGSPSNPILSFKFSFLIQIVLPPSNDQNKHLIGSFLKIVNKFKKI